MGGSGQRTSTVISNISNISNGTGNGPFVVGADAIIVGISEGAQVIHHRGVVFG
jgi:hypothetical protein